MMIRGLLAAKDIGLICLGGAVGALLRYFVSLGVHQFTPRDFPYGTLVVNVIGALLIGIFAVSLLEKTAQATSLRALIIIGGLGAFTTFSTFSYETISLIGNGALLRAAFNIGANLLFCLSATWIGLVCGRLLWMT